MCAFFRDDDYSLWYWKATKKDDRAESKDKDKDIVENLNLERKAPNKSLVTLTGSVEIFQIVSRFRGPTVYLLIFQRVFIILAFFPNGLTCSTNAKHWVVK